MGKWKWLALSSALVLCVAAGLGIGLALPRAWKSHDGSTFFRELVDETGPGESGRALDGTLAARLRKKYMLHVIRSVPETYFGTDGYTSVYFEVVIVNDGSSSLTLDRQELLRELEDYLKELAERKGAAKFSTKDYAAEGKRAGFTFSYEAGEGEAMLYKVEARDELGIVMKLRERIRYN